MTAVRSLIFVALFYLWSASGRGRLPPILLGPAQLDVCACSHFWGRGVMGLLR